MNARAASRAVLLAVVASSPLTLAAQPAGGTQPVTHEALWMMKRVGAPALSPDGKWVVVSVAEPSYDEKKEVSDLWIVPADGSAPPEPSPPKSRPTRPGNAPKPSSNPADSATYAAAGKPSATMSRQCGCRRIRSRPRPASATAT